jgi:CubicO group peptidase (beta-lactamase class C family)
MQPLQGLSGSVLVTRDGSVLSELAQGAADTGTAAACTAQTRFQLCSVSKQFAAAAALLLVDSGHLDLAEPVARWLPAGPQVWQRITLHQLLSHTSGLGHWSEVPGLDPSQSLSSAEQLTLIQQAPLRSEPGATWHYSSPGFLLVGHIVAQASGQPYPDFVAGHILSPLGLACTSLGGVPSGGPVARGYLAGRPVPAWDLDTMGGTGDIWSTAGDLTRFTAALHDGALVSAGSLRAMRTPHAPLPADQAGDPQFSARGYGYGMFTGDFGGHAAYYHPGDNPGYRSFVAWIPDLAASVVMLVNDEDTDVDNLIGQLIQVALSS